MLQFGFGHGTPGTVVAVGAENEYANVIGQIGGRYVTVSAILSNPNTDPHTFESSPQVAQTVGAAELVVQNGVGYDTFMNKIEAAAPNSHRKVIDVQQLLKLPTTTPNPHLWYQPSTMPAVAEAIGSDLAALEPSHTAYSRSRVAQFKRSLAPWYQAIASLKSRLPGAPVATTEPVADYMLTAAGVDNLTPFTFQADVMNGVDPAPQALLYVEGLLRESQGEGVRLQPAGHGFSYPESRGTGTPEQHPHRRRLRDDAHAGVRLPELDDRRGTRPHERLCHRRVGTKALDMRAASGARLGGDGDLLVLDDVTVVLSGRAVLRDVSFAVRPGEFTALIGSNGAGKTTLFRVILGLQATASGQVVIEGAPRARRGGSMGYVPQQVAIDPDIPLRARDLVSLGLDGHRFGMPLPSRRRRDLVDDMLAAVDADGFADARVGTLSGGELQRVLIAHALVSEPRLLLLDEPLANLDLRSEQEVVQVLARVTREQNVAVLISAHDMNPLLPVMDRVVYLAGGRVASGTSDEVVRSEVLSELYGSPVTVLHVRGRVLVVAEPIPEEATPEQPTLTLTPSRPEAGLGQVDDPWGSGSSVAEGH